MGEKRKKILKGRRITKKIKRDGNEKGGRKGIMKEDRKRIGNGGKEET